MHRCNYWYPDGDFIRVIEIRVNKFTCTCFQFNSLSISPLTLFKYGEADQNTKTIKQYRIDISKFIKSAAKRITKTFLLNALLKRIPKIWNPSFEIEKISIPYIFNFWKLDVPNVLHFAILI